MAFNSRWFSRVVLLLFAVVLVAGCGGKEERKAKYLEKGKSYLHDRNYDKARIEFKNVLQIDPKTAEAHRYLGEVEEGQQNWRKAHGHYRKAIELNPELIGPRVRLARLYLAEYTVLRNRKEESGAANALSLAKEQADEVLKRDPENLEALTIEATIWVDGGEKAKAIQQLEKVLAKDPGLRSAAALLSTLYEREGRKEEAESVLVRAIENSDNPVPLQRRLSQLYRNHKQNAKAEEVLRAIVRAHPDELGYRLSLASFLSQTDQIDKAEQVLRETIEAAPDDAQRYLLLTEFLAAKRGHDVATRELKAVIARRPDLVDLQFGLVRLYLATERRDEAQQVLEELIASQGTSPDGLKARLQLARLVATSDPQSPRLEKLIDEVLTENPADNDALMMRGRLAMLRKDYVAAINDFRSVLKDQPNSVRVLQLLASAHQAIGEKELARDMLARAIEAGPDNTASRLAMARLLGEDGDIDAALEQVDEILKRDAAQQKALEMKFELLARKGDMAGLEEVVRQMKESAPDKENGYIGEVRLRMAQKNFKAALDILDRVLEKNPASIAALRAKIDVLAAQKKYREAVSVVDVLQKLQPDAMESYFLKGRLLQELGDAEGALAHYELALEKAPDNAQVLTTLIDLESRQKGGKERAEKRLKAILAANPGHPLANSLLGRLYLEQKAYPEAEQAFLRQLEAAPGNDLVYAQLAQARIGQDDLEGAAQAYEQGLETLRDNVRLLAGLAGVRERQKNYEAAIGLYEKALEQQPENILVANNLAALLVDHRSDAASLEKATRLVKLLEKTDQSAIRDTVGWVHYRLGDYDKAVEILKTVVEKEPRIMVFQYHLGMAYLKQGDKAAAKRHLSRAVGKRAQYDGVEEAKAALAGL